MDRSLQLNRISWDERAPLHAASKDYEVERLVQQHGHLSETVRFDLPLLGDIDGLDTVHLQCHIGTDTLSLARLGAKVCGLDYSKASLAEARALAERCALPIQYVESDVYAADKVLLKRVRSTWSTPVLARSAGCPASSHGHAPSRHC